MTTTNNTSINFDEIAHSTYCGWKVFIAEPEDMLGVEPIVEDEFGHGAYHIEDFDKFIGDFPYSVQGTVEEDGSEKIGIAECINEENEDFSHDIFCIWG